MDSHRHDSAVQEIAEHVWIYLRVCVCYSVIDHVCVCVCVILWSTMCACVCVCLHGSFKGSECGGLPFHRMSAVVQLWSTARPYIWSTEKIHQGYLLPQFSGHVFHRFLCTLGAILCASACAILRHCDVPSAPDILRLFGPTSWVCAVFPGCSWPLWENPYRAQERQEEWGERKARRVIEGFRVILRPKMAVSTCLHNLLELNI